MAKGLKVCYTHVQLYLVGYCGVETDLVEWFNPKMG